MKILKPRITYIAFLECEVRGKWQTTEEERIEINGEEHPAGRHTYFAEIKGCEVWMVQPSLKRRAFVFKKHSEIEIVGTTVKFNQDDVVEELAVDEEKQRGKIQ